MRNKKGKIKKVILGKNINCSAIWANLTILFFAIRTSLLVSLISAYLFRRDFKRDMTLEEEIVKRRETAKKLKSKISIIFVAIVATIIGTALSLAGPIPNFEGALLAIIDTWPYLILGMVGLIFSLCIGDRILYSRHPKWIYWIMPLIVLITPVIILVIWAIIESIIIGPKGPPNIEYIR